MNNAAYKESQRSALIGTICNLAKDLQKLAAHPDAPNHQGPLFYNVKMPAAATANDNDSMLGTMMMEGMLGTAFLDAASEAFGSWTEDVANTIDLSHVLDCYDTYISEISNKDEDNQKTAAHGKGSFARIAGKSIANGFNMRSTISEGLQAFYNDMPKRMRIEKALATYIKQLEDLDNTMPTYAMSAPQLAA